MIRDKTSNELFFDKGETLIAGVFFPKDPFESFLANTNKNFKIENEFLSRVEEAKE